MVEKRISGWFLFSAIFVTVVFGLFFTITERKSWPQQTVHLSATDMKLAPRVSTVWCEALALSSDHPFIAYQVSNTLHIDPKVLTRQKVNMRIRLGNGETSTKLKYFLLPSTVMEITSCSSVPGAYLVVFRGEVDLNDCLNSKIKKESRSSDDYSDDSSSYDDDGNDDGWSFQREKELQKKSMVLNKCSSFISIQEIPLSQQGQISYGCEDSLEVHPLKINISSADDYIVAITNNNPHRTSNVVGLRLQIDRATYAVRKTGESFNLCSLSTACTIALDFASNDRALIWIPEEPNAGRSTFTVHVQCKPRLALFAILSVCLPLVLFLAVAHIVRADRRRRSQRNSGVPDALSGTDSSSRTVCDSAYATPLLLGTGNAATESNREQSECQLDREPPSYDSLYETPPPYSCVKQEELKGS